MSRAARFRVAVIVSHPIQYFVPLYERLTRRDDIALKVFFTWHDAQQPVRDRGFGHNIAWDIPLTAGYCHELVTNVSSDPGTHRFLGLRNPALPELVARWRPDVAIVHGWAWLSHLQALRALRPQGIRTLFRGDSHLLDETGQGLRWQAKRMTLSQIFAWPSGFLVTGAANQAYYQAFGVSASRLHPCPHSIDVARFAEPSDELEAAAARWRQELDIAPDRTVVLFAGKFEPRKRPIELARAVLALDRHDVMLLFVGAGELQSEIETIAVTHPERIRVLPFQNQSRMPVVYRLGDLFVLPSAYGESWGLAVNEALAASRPVLVSDRVGSAPDAVNLSCGRVFAGNDLPALLSALDGMTRDRVRLLGMRAAAARCARRFDIAVTEEALVAAVAAVCA